VRSVCTGCARVCSVNVWRRKKEWHVRALGDAKNRAIYRITAFNNPEINGPWICNKGYDLHKIMSRERAVPMVRERAVSPEEAIAEARGLLARAANPAVIVSAHASNEELEAFKSTLAARVTVYARQDCVPGPGEVVQDNLLIRADKNPNTFGVKALFGIDAYDSARGHDVVLVWGEAAGYERVGKAKVIHLTPFAPPRERRAEVVIPISHVFERSGSFCNFEGKRAIFAKVFDKPASALDAGDLFGRLAS
jgi:NADH-quinone oxidoreductase subunit G